MPFLKQFLTKATAAVLLLTALMFFVKGVAAGQTGQMVYCFFWHLAGGLTLMISFDLLKAWIRQ